MPAGRAADDGEGAGQPVRNVPAVSGAERRRVLRPRRRRRAPRQAAGRRRRTWSSLSGPSGVGKTSLLRAGLTPALARRELTVRDPDQLPRSRARAGARDQRASASRRPSPARTRPTTWAASRASAKGGLVLILDHLEEVLAPARGPAPGAGAAAVVELALRVVEEAPRTRLVLSIDDGAFARLDAITSALGGPAGKLGAPAPMTLPRARRGRRSPTSSSAAPCSRGRRSRAAWRPRSRPISCRDGPCRPFDLQLVVRAIVDLRLASLRRYRRSGGPAVLPALWLADVCGAGGRRARAARAARRQRARRRQRSRPAACRPGAGATAAPRRWRRCRRAGCWCAHTRGRKEVFALAHPALREIDRGLRDRRSRARHGRAPRAHAGGSRPASACACRELVAVHRHLRGTLTPTSAAPSRRSLGGAALRISLGVAVALLVVAGALRGFAARVLAGASIRADGGRGGARRRAPRPAAHRVPQLPAQPPAARLDHRRHRLRRGRARAARRSRASPRGRVSGTLGRARRRGPRARLAARGAERPAPGPARDRQGAARRSRRRRGAEARVQRSGGARRDPVGAGGDRPGRRRRGRDPGRRAGRRARPRSAAAASRSPRP